MRGVILNKNQLIELLNGNRRLFTEVYEAAAEQYLLLALKARHLYSNGQKKWFIEQDEVLKKLMTQRDEIVEAYEGFFLTYPSRQPLDVAMHVMSSFYQGFDDNNKIMQTWGEMNRVPTKGGSSTDYRNARQDYNETRQRYVQQDLFNLLSESTPTSTSIPLDERMGYSHHDLAISFSCSDIIISSLNEFFNIDHLDILDKTVECFSRDDSDFNDLASLLLKRRNMDDDSKNDAITRSAVINKIELLFSKISETDVQYFLSIYVGLVAQATHEWLMGTQRHFKFKYPVNYNWKYKVVDLREEDANYLSSLTNNDILGQISISRSSIIQLIRRNGATGFDDVALEISRELGALYSELLKQSSKIDENSVDENKEHIESNDNDTDKSKVINPDRATAYLEHLTKWHEKNRVLLIKDEDAKRQDKVNVAGWLCGLIACDLKEGIPNKPTRYINNVFEMAKRDGHLSGMAVGSIASLYRYYRNIKNGIDKSTELINKQKKTNQSYPFNGAIYSSRPLWDQ